jgi:uncharacterized phage protein (TIGR02220 family)
MAFSTLKALWAVRDDRTLTATEQRIVVMLIAFSDETGACWPSVPKLAQAARTSRSAVQRALKLLRTGRGPILVTAVSRETEHKATMSHLYQLSLLEGGPHTERPPPHTGLPPAPPQAGGGPHTERREGPIQDPEEDREKKTVKEDIEEEAAGLVFDHWSLQLFTKIHPKRKAQRTQKRMDKIRARLRDGITVDELKLVIDNVAGTPFMLGDNDRGLPYIEPSTIFANSEKVETWLAKKPPKNDDRVQRGASDERVAAWERGGRKIFPYRQPDSGYSAVDHARDGSKD